MIYLTTYDPISLNCTAASVDSGFDSLATVRATMGEPERSGTRWLAYPEAGVAFSDFVFCLTNSSNSRHTPAIESSE